MLALLFVCHLEKCLGFTCLFDATNSFYQLAGVLVGIVIVTTWGLLSKMQLLFDPLLFLLDCRALLVAKSLVSCEICSFLSKNKHWFCIGGP